MVGCESMGRSTEARHRRCMSVVWRFLVLDRGVYMTVCILKYDLYSNDPVTGYVMVKAVFLVPFFTQASHLTC